MYYGVLDGRKVKNFPIQPYRTPSDTVVFIHPTLSYGVVSHPIVSYLRNEWLWVEPRTDTDICD